MSAGDRILIYPPKTAYPDGEPLKAITFAGTVTGSEPEPSDVIPGGFRIAADLSAVAPIPLADVREHPPTTRSGSGPSSCR